MGIGGVLFFFFCEGFVCDNVFNYEVVFVFGEIVNVNEYENSDLWIFFCGGGNNFGVVICFDFRIFFQFGKFWGGSVFYFFFSWLYYVGVFLLEFWKKDVVDLNVYVQLSIGYFFQFVQFVCQSQLFYIGVDVIESMFEVFKLWVDRYF